MKTSRSMYLIASAVLSSSAMGNLIFEDNFVRGNKQNYYKEFGDGFTGGALSKAENKARELGNEARKKMESWGFERSGGARARMERNTGVTDTHRGRSKIYHRGGRVV